MINFQGQRIFFSRSSPRTFVEPWTCILYLYISPWPNQKEPNYVRANELIEPYTLFYKEVSYFSSTRLS